MRAVFGAALLLFFALLAVSCSHRADAPVMSFPMQSQASGLHSLPATEQDFLLGPKDALVIQFYGDPTMNTEIMVRPDGMISIPLFQESVFVTGMTMDELENLVEVELSRYLVNPDVFISLQAVGSHQVFVLGEVRNPQVVSDSPMMLSSVIARCGGFSPDAVTSQVLVLRRSPGKESQVVEVDFDALLSGDSALPDLPLQRYDLVIVPRSKIADLRNFVNNIFEPMISVPRFGLDMYLFYEALHDNYMGYGR
jgi:polysaccharide export outer membrane protein